MRARHRPARRPLPAREPDCRARRRRGCAARRFIRENATRRLTVRDVVSYLGVSRRLADLRFREFRKQSILEAITDARLGEVKRQLAAGHERIGQIAFKCGFENPNYLKILFRRHFGVCMRDWRKSVQAPTTAPRSERRQGTRTRRPAP